MTGSRFNGLKHTSLIRAQRVRSAVIAIASAITMLVVTCSYSVSVEASDTGVDNALTALIPTVAPGAIGDKIINLHYLNMPRKTFGDICSLLNHKKYRKALMVLREEARQRDSSWSDMTIGDLYESGLGCEKNEQTAFKYYIRAARLGNHFAQRQVMNAYLNNKGVTESMLHVQYWYDRAVAVPQRADALLFLSHLFQGNHMRQQNINKASHYMQLSVHQLRILAKQGVSSANYELGVLYEYGVGRKKNIPEARMFYSRAASEGFWPAHYLLARISERN